MTQPNVGPDTPDEAVWPDDAVEVARIVDAFGIKGGLKVLPFAADPKALLGSRRWFLKPAEPRPGANARRMPNRSDEAAFVLPSVLRITQARVQGDVLVASAREVVDRNAAEALRGARVFVSRASFPSTEDDEYYWIDLIGLQVFNRDGVELGRVSDLLDTGAHCVLRIKRDDDGTSKPEVGDETGERLIPFVAAYIDQVSLAQGRINVDWGLDY
jgi:16S rRNA processing protein RimM